MMTNIRSIVPLALIFISPGCQDNPKVLHENNPSRDIEWNLCISYEDVVGDYPDQVRFLFNMVDLTVPGLASVKTALDINDTVEACAELIAYFETNPAGESYRKSAGAYSSSTVENVMADILPASGDWFKIPRLKNGGLAWSWEGPSDYTNNQMHQINRFSWMDDLLFAGLDGSNASLVKLDGYLRDWCAHADKHQQFDTSGRAGPILDAGIRMKSKVLPITFYSFLSAHEFQDATRILMLAAIARHGPYLRHYHRPHGNHKTMELLGLLTLADAFPEFKDRDAYIDYVRLAVADEHKYSFYVEEGVQKELAQGYHKIVIKDYEEFKALFAKIGVEPDPLLDPIIRKGWEHLALTCKPNGHSLMLNDENDASHEKDVVSRAEIYDRPDWLYPFSNGSEGVEPEKGPSVMYAWSGRMVSRDDWGAFTRWSVFDLGPFGIGHQHSDKLHISIFAHGRDLLVDAGRYTYLSYNSRSPIDWRGYFRRSWSHNVILVDGNTQNDEDKEVTRPATDWEISDEYDFALGTFEKGWDEIDGIHQRAFFNIKGKCWLICDRISLEASSDIQALWHFHPDCTVPGPQGSQVMSTDPGLGNLRIVPVSAAHLQWNVRVVKGQEVPTYQGWYSERQNRKEPSPCAIYEAQNVKSASFAWLITSGSGTPPTFEAEILSSEDEKMSIRIRDDQAAEYVVEVDFGRKQGQVSTNL